MVAVLGGRTEGDGIRKGKCLSVKQPPPQELGRGSQGVAKLAKDAAGREFCVWGNPASGMEWRSVSNKRAQKEKDGWLLDVSKKVQNYIVKFLHADGSFRSFWMI